MPKTEIHPAIEACYRIQGIRDQQEKREATLRLWHEYVEGEKYRASPAEVVNEITHLMCLVAAMDADHHAAIAHTQRLLAHPHIAQLEPIFYADHLAALMRYYLLLGDEAEALIWAQKTREVKGVSDYVLCIQLRNPLLYEYILEHNESEIASVALTDFVWELVQRQDRRLKKRRLPPQATYGELVDALGRTFSRTERRMTLSMWPMATQVCGKEMSVMSQRLLTALEKQEPNWQPDPDFMKNVEQRTEELARRMEVLNSEVERATSR